MAWRSRKSNSLREQPEQEGGGGEPELEVPGTLFQRQNHSVFEYGDRVTVTEPPNSRTGNLHYRDSVATNPCI
jgi:hypothetical protein